MGEYSCFELKSFGPESNCKLKKMKIQILVLAFALVAVITAAPAAPAKKAAAVDPDEKALDDAIAKNGPEIDKALKDVTLDDALSDSDVQDLAVSNMNDADVEEVANSMTPADTDEALSNLDVDDVASNMTSADADDLAAASDADDDADSDDDDATVTVAAAS